MWFETAMGGPLILRGALESAERRPLDLGTRLIVIVERQTRHR